MTAFNPACGRIDPTLKVLQSFSAQGRNTNPYLLLLVESLSDEVSIRRFSWKVALTKKFDVFHVHWPELLLRGSSRWKTAARQVLFVLLLLRLRLTKTAIVRTLHNEVSHEPGTRNEAILVELLESATSLWIRLNSSTEPPTTSPVRTIPHGDYRAWFKEKRRADPISGRVVFFGLIRPYKGVDRLISAFRGLSDSALSLCIVGRPSSPQLESEIRSSAANDPRIRLDLHYVDDDRLSEEVTASELVILPYEEMHNSGALLLALSLGRPVLVPWTPTTDALKREVGAQWVYTYRERLTSSTISNALAEIGLASPSGEPDLSLRDWHEIGEAHLDAYRDAVAAVARPPCWATVGRLR